MPRRPASPSPIDPPTPAPAAEKRVGGFRYTEFGPIVSTRPAEASALLRSYLDANKGNVSATARALDTTYRTVARWIHALTAAGHDPRESVG